MENFYHIMLSQWILSVLLTLVVVRGEIIGKCGSGAVVGQPYDMKCTNIPETVNNGINVFLVKDSDDIAQANSIVFCSTTSAKFCAARNTSLYNVVTPHNESLFFTILKVTEDDIGKKLYCVDDTKLDSTSKQSCTLALEQTTEATTTSMGDDDGGDGLSDGAIAGIVIGVIAVCVVVIIVIVVIYKKKKSERASL